MRVSASYEPSKPSWCTVAPRKLVQAQKSSRRPSKASERKVLRRQCIAMAYTTTLTATGAPHATPLLMVQCK